MRTGKTGPAWRRRNKILAHRSKGYRPVQTRRQAGRSEYVE